MKKILIVLSSFTLVLSVVPMLVGATAPSYSVHITTPVAQTNPLNISGTSGATNYVGQPSAQHVVINWGDGSANTDLPVPIGAFSGNTFTFPWSASHPYNNPTTQSFKIIVNVCHQTCSGNEGSGDSTDTSIVVVPPQGNLIVQKVVINDNGGTTLPASFSFSVNGGAAINFVQDTTTTGHKNLTLNTGTYTITETAAAGYATTYSNCSNISVPLNGSVTCTITNNDVLVNVAPVAQNNSLVTNEDTSVSTIRVATDSNIPAQTLTYSIVANPIHGTLSGLNANTGAVTYNPNANYNGADSFTFKANDGSLDSNTATVSITVNPVNDAPVASNSSITTPEDTGATVLLTATDIDGNTLTYSVVANPSHGSVSPITGNQLTYLPTPDYNGPDSFTFKANDGSLDSNTATVSVTVTPANDAPTIDAIEDQTVDELDEVSFTATGDDIDNDTLVYSIASGSVGGMAIDSSSGEFTWTPNEFQGPGTYPITINVSDGSTVATEDVTITVNEVNMAPVATGDSVATHMNESVDVTLSATDGDYPDNDLTFTVSSPAANGDVNIDNNIATYEPNEDFTGSDSFDFQVCDEDDACDTATISVDVSNDAPTMDTIEDQTVDEMTVLSVTPTASDPSDDALTFTLFAGPDGAAVDFTTGEFTWIPTEEQGAGVYQATISVTDGNLTDSKTFTITVNEVNVAPVALDDSAATDEDVAVTIVLPTATDSDVLVQGITYIPVDEPTNGVAFLSGNSVLYTPNFNFNGIDSFTYMANDGEVDSNVATITITVEPVNDAPTIELEGSATEAITVNGSYTEDGATCSDVDGDETEVIIDGAVNTGTVGTYILTYKCTDGELESDTVTRTVEVQAAPAACADGISNDADGLIDSADPGCHTDGNADNSESYNSNDNDETDPIVDLCPNINGVQAQLPSGYHIADNGNCTKTGHGSTLVGSGPVSSGEVLGAETSCGIFVEKYLKRGLKGNDKESVSKVQTFLNDYMKSGLAVDSNFGPKTETALKAFQLAHKDKILTPWHLTVPTGIFYLTTQTEVNNLMCPALALPIPSNLVPFSKNPVTPKV